MTKTVLITGASNGIGLELAKIHAEKGHNLVVVARSEDKLNALKQPTGKCLLDQRRSDCERLTLLLELTAVGLERRLAKFEANAALKTYDKNGTAMLSHFNNTISTPDTNPISYRLEPIRHVGSPHQVLYPSAQHEIHGHTATHVPHRCV